jgi:hypothetical protein
MLWGTFTDHKASHYVFPTPLLRRPSYAQDLPHQPVLDNHQPTFLSECERPSFPPKKTNKNYISVYFDHHIFG